MTGAKRARSAKSKGRSVRKTARTKKPPTCPECGSHEIVPVVHRPVTPALQHAIETGTAILADREEWEGMMEWFCKSCGCDWSRHSRRFKKPGGVNATSSR